DRGGFYFTEAGAKDLIVRQKTASDSPLPSGNAVAAIALLEPDQPDIAWRTLQVFSGQLERGAEGMSSMVKAPHPFVKQNGPIEIAPSPRKPERPLRPEEQAARVVAFAADWRSRTQLDVRLEVAAGHHINAHVASMGLIATDLSVVGLEAEVDYPVGE